MVVGDSFVEGGAVGVIDGAVVVGTVVVVVLVVVVVVVVVALTICSPN